MTASWVQMTSLGVRTVHFLTRPNLANGQIRVPEQTSRQMGALARHSKPPWPGESHAL